MIDCIIHKTKGQSVIDDVRSAAGKGVYMLIKPVYRLMSVLTVCIVCMVSISSHAQEQARPEHRAEPIELPGVPNLHKVDSGLYRSAQPDEIGMINLRKMGIRTIVNLRAFHSDSDEIGDIKLACKNIPVNTWDIKEDDAVEFLKIVTETENLPVLVHCQHGADRTGAMIAVYRIAVQGWSKREAIQEMTRGGFGFHEIWINLPSWIESLDIDEIREKAGISPVKR